MRSVKDCEAQQLHRQILRHFAATGQAPTLQAMRAMMGSSSSGLIEECLDLLEEWGAIYRDPQSRALRSVYPFSAVPTAHRVKLASSVEVYAMCAIDALGMPFMLEADAVIRSQCHHCEAPIEVEIQRNKMTRARPPETVVWYSTNEACCVTAVDQCPYLNFFCSPHHLEQWRQRHPEQKGQLLSLLEALDRGRQVFGSLLKDRQASNRNE